MDPCMIADVTGESARRSDDCACAQCGATWPRDPSLPPCVIEDGVEHCWCSSSCSEAWFDADPKRREGWIAVADLTPERLAQELDRVGLLIEADPVMLS